VRSQPATVDDRYNRTVARQLMALRVRNRLAALALSIVFIYCCAMPARALSVTSISATANCDAVTGMSITGLSAASTAVTVRDGLGVIIAGIVASPIGGLATPGPFMPVEGPTDNTQWTVNDGTTSLTITPSTYASQCAPASFAVDPGNFNAKLVRGHTASPPGTTYGLSNTGGSAIYQPATAYFPGGTAFFTLSAPATIGAFGSGGVTLTFNTAASHLAPGQYTATIAFSNAAKLSLVTTRQITLVVVANTPHDFSGDSTSDILWYNTASGQVVVWLINGTTVTGGGSPGSTTTPWTIVGQRDFNGDGFSDILWRNGTSGQLIIWLLNGGTLVGGGSPGSVAGQWSVAGTGDFNNDGMGDVLWYNSSTGQAVIWLLNGASLIGGGSPGAVPSPWTIAGIADFNGDGFSDILWYNPSSGQAVQWLLNGASLIGGGSPGSAPSPWAVAGTGDFNGDGFGDILWRNNTTGQTVVWLLNGASVIGGGSIGSAPSPWTIAETGDFNGDNKSDILWYNSASGQLIVWLLNGASVIGSGSPGSAPSPWLLQTLNAD
jgi:hypothetical protein